MFTPSLYAADSSDLHFLTLADIHFDPFTTCYQSRGRCQLILKLRQAPASAWSSILLSLEKTKPEYRQDTNYFLLKSALDAAQKVAQKNQVKFVIVLGDFLAHDYRKNYIKYANDASYVGYQAFVKKTIEFVTQQIAKTFPNVDVYSVVGNNDTYQKDYEIDPKGLFLSDANKLWSSLIKNKKNQYAMQRNFDVAGYYAVTIPDAPDLKLIVLNSVLFSYKAKGKNIANVATDELNWLHNQLQLAHANHQKVLIAMHIPAGIDVYATLQFRLFRLIKLWHIAYTERFESLLKEFAPELVGVLAGHLHSDWFQLLTLDNQNKISITGTPSISPIYGNNPGFKLYSYSLKTKQLDDFQTYHYPINREKSWHVEYDFNRTYQANCKPCDIEGLNNLSLKNQFDVFYKRFYALGAKKSPVITEWNPHYRCALQVIGENQYKNCLS